MYMWPGSRLAPVRSKDLASCVHTASSLLPVGAACRLLAIQSASEFPLIHCYSTRQLYHICPNYLALPIRPFAYRSQLFGRAREKQLYRVAPLPLPLTYPFYCYLLLLYCEPIAQRHALFRYTEEVTVKPPTR